MTLGSVPGINTRYRPAVHGLYGNVAIREIYSVTECMFGQQRDERKASRTRPNYDLFFFEVETRSGIKMLHEMRPGGDGKYDRLDAGAAALLLNQKTGSVNRRPDSRFSSALLSLYRPRCQQQMAGMVEAAALRLG